MLSNAQTENASLKIQIDSLTGQVAQLNQVSADL